MRIERKIVDGIEEITLEMLHQQSDLELVPIENDSLLVERAFSFSKEENKVTSKKTRNLSKRQSTPIGFNRFLFGFIGLIVCLGILFKTLKVIYAH